MAGGLLAGNRRAGTPRSKSAMSAARYRRPEDERVVETVFDVAERLGHKPGQIALAWLLTKREVTAPIIGTTKPHHLDDALGALAITLSPEDIAALEAPYVPQAVFSHT
jgi:aryl-alcohol dehydrogenase-like predicted oxidoreductase